MGKLDEKVALITGAGSGIGRATALLFAKEGARIVVADCSVARGEETVRTIKDAGGEAIFVRTDVSEAADLEQVIRAAVDTYGRLDILHNNAGVVGTAVPAAETTEQQWDAIIGTNLKGVFLGTKYAIPVMLSQGGGVIINTGSGAGLVGAPGLSAYSASKGGVIQFTKTVALEYARQNIRVNCICPGGIKTPMSDLFLVTAEDRQQFIETVPLGRMGRPEEIALAALYLASDDSSFATGTILAIDGSGTAG